MFDLHVHTTASDGDLDARGIIDEAKRIGLTQMAITDHDTIGNVKECIRLGIENGILVVPGVEISVKIDKGQMHILGYGFDIEHQEFNQVMGILRDARMERNEKIIKVLNDKFGIDITLEDVKKQSTGDSLGKPHFAKALMEKGIVSNSREAFSEKYLLSPEIKSVKRKVLKMKESIELINRAGGIAVLAHPHTLNLSNEETYEKIKELKSCGLSGVEAYHSDHSQEQAEAYRKMAEKEGLIITCGSDYHGPIAKPNIKLGKGINENLPTKDDSIFKKFYDKLYEKEIER